MHVHRTQLAGDADSITDMYFHRQQHGSLVAYLQGQLTAPGIDTDAFIQVGGFTASRGFLFDNI